jgi:glucose-1-phosphate thymidylyltransferase
VAIVGVIPAAGHARRLGRLPCSKEMLPVGGRPVLEYVLERMRLATADIRVVTRPEKADVAEHARSLAAAVVEGRPATVAESIRLGCEGLGRQDVVLLGFPDTIWEPEDGFVRLLEALDGTTDVALGCFRSAELERSDVVVADADGSVRAVQVKPASPEADVIWGCAAAHAAALDGLGRHDEPGHLFDELARTGRVRAVRFEGELVDIGTREALDRLDRRRVPA